MTEPALFPEADAYDGDPLRPDTTTPTPVSIVATLTRPDRERRLQWLIEQAHGIYSTAIAERSEGRELIAECLLFSGGNDSTVLGHLFRRRATCAVHANTTIGIEATRQFVRDTCALWGLPLIEERPPHSYADLVLGRVNGWPGGFPGPGAHGTIYQRIKERALDRARHTLGVANSRSQFVTFIAGRRRDESDKRADVPLSESDGTVVWVSPIALWTKLDLNTYRLTHDVPVNRVAELLHMSGECLCGSYAGPGELDEIRLWFPEVAAEIDALAAEVLAAGIVAPEFCTWGHGLRGSSKLTAAGRLCSSCAPRMAGLWDDPPPSS